VGEFKNGGREYQPTGSPVQVNVHDFPDEDLGKALPYGIYDVAANTGWVSVGADHDTSAFAVQTLRRWWNTVGRHRYPDTDRLLICADGGGANGYQPGRGVLVAHTQDPLCLAEFEQHPALGQCGDDLHAGRADLGVGDDPYSRWR
jgi:hypothetical protein